MGPPRPPDFASIADAKTKGPSCTVAPKSSNGSVPAPSYFKLIQSITTPKGVSPWWQFLESRQLSTGVTVPGVKELQDYAERLGVHDRDYARVRAAVTEE